LFLQAVCLRYGFIPAYSIPAFVPAFQAERKWDAFRALGFTQGCDVSGFQPEEYELGPGSKLHILIV